MLEVLDGAPVTGVARRYGVARQTVHKWLRRYAAGGIGALADGSTRPGSCPHRMSPVTEARVVALRRAHPDWGPARIVCELGCARVVPVPGRSPVYRALVRHGLVDPKKRRRRREDYRRWERSRAMERWQMDVMGGVILAGGTAVPVVTGIGDHSRFCVCAQVVARATAAPVCQALQGALARQGVPGQILTGNGKVFTGRFGPGPGPVLFDRICAGNGIRHLLTAPYSPATTGKVERLHKTMRKEFFRLHEREFAAIAAAQAALDGRVEHYDTARPHQPAGMRPPAGRFRLAQATPAAADAASPAPVTAPASASRRPPGVTRWVDHTGTVSVAGFRYRAGPVLAGEIAEVVCAGAWPTSCTAGCWPPPTRSGPGPVRIPLAPASRWPRRARAATTGPVVTRIADGAGAVSFAGPMDHAGRAWARHRAEVPIVAGPVQLAWGEKVIRVHAIRHDRAKEHGAFANPGGRPRCPKTAA